MQEIRKEGSERSNGGGSDADGRLYHGPFDEVDTEPGVVVCGLELPDINYAHNGR